MEFVLLLFLWISILLVPLHSIYLSKKLLYGGGRAADNIVVHTWTSIKWLWRIWLPCKMNSFEHAEHQMNKNHPKTNNETTLNPQFNLCDGRTFIYTYKVETHCTTRYILSTTCSLKKREKTREKNKNSPRTSFRMFVSLSYWYSFLNLVLAAAWYAHRLSCRNQKSVWVFATELRKWNWLQAVAMSISRQP